MARKAKKSNNISRKALLILAGALVIIFVVLGIFLSFRPNAELIIVTAPSRATVRLDGKVVKNGARKIHAGKHKIELVLDGLESKKQEFEIAANETKSVNLYLTGEGEDFLHYLRSEEDIKLLELIGDESAKKFVSEYETAKTITELLPITVVDGKLSSRLELGRGCKRAYCLKMTSSNETMKEKMLTKLKSLGYAPEDYEIQYEMVDE